jgi:hypothetical protein
MNKNLEPSPSKENSVTHELYWHHLHVAVLGLVLEPQGSGWHQTRAEQSAIPYFAAQQLRARWVITPLKQLEMTWETSDCQPR